MRAPNAAVRSWLTVEMLLMAAGVISFPGCGTSSQNGSLCSLEKGKAMLLVCPGGMMRRQ